MGARFRSSVYECGGGDGNDEEQAGEAEDDGGVDEEDSGAEGVFAPATPVERLPLKEDNDCEHGGCEDQPVVLSEIHDFEGGEGRGVRVRADLLHFRGDPDGDSGPDEKGRSEEGSGFQVRRRCCPASLFGWSRINWHNGIGQGRWGEVTGGRVFSV